MTVTSGGGSINSSSVVGITTWKRFVLFVYITREIVCNGWREEKVTTSEV